MRALLLSTLSLSLSCGVDSGSVTPENPFVKYDKACGVRPLYPVYSSGIFDPYTQRMCILDSEYAALDVWVHEVNMWIDCVEIEAGKEAGQP